VLASVGVVGISDPNFGLSSNNLIRVNGGSLVVTNGGGGVLLMGNGGGAASLILNSGTVVVDQLVATNGSHSIVQLNGGQFSSGGTAVTNSQLFAVGTTNGNAAVYTLLGGYHTFANNLEVRTNASLTGCGTINATTVTLDAGATVLANCGATLTFSGSFAYNYGVIRVLDGGVFEAYSTLLNYGVIDALNGSAIFHSGFLNEGVVLTSNSVPVISSIQAVPPDVQISFSTSGGGATYGVAYTTNFVNAIWTTLTNNISGTGGIITVTDPGAALLPQRYYKAYLAVPPEP
jgi:hypothetical protein